MTYKDKLTELSNLGYDSYVSIYLRTNFKFNTTEGLIPIDFKNQTFFWCNNKEGSDPYILIPSKNNYHEIEFWDKSSDFKNILTYMGLLTYYLSLNVIDNIYLEINHALINYGYPSLQLIGLESYHNDVSYNKNLLKIDSKKLVEFQINGGIIDGDLIILSYYREAQSLLDINKFYSFMSYFKILDYYFIKDKKTDKNHELCVWVNNEFTNLIFIDWLGLFTQQEKYKLDTELKNRNKSAGEFLVYIRDSITHSILNNKSYNTNTGFYPYRENDYEIIKFSLPLVRIMVLNLMKSDKFLNQPEITIKLI